MVVLTELDKLLLSSAGSSSTYSISILGCWFTLHYSHLILFTSLPPHGWTVSVGLVFTERRFRTRNHGGEKDQKTYCKIAIGRMKN